VCGGKEKIEREQKARMLEIFSFFKLYFSPPRIARDTTIEMLERRGKNIIEIYCSDGGGDILLCDAQSLFWGCWYFLI
jgi:hypothetical protein